MLLCAGRAASIEHPLLAGHTAYFRGASGTARATVQFRDDGIGSLVGDPRCPAVSRLRLAASIENVVEIALPCSNWRATRRGGYAYLDPQGTAGGVRRVILEQDKLVARFGGPSLAPIGGPVPFVEVALSVGSAGVCGRFTRFDSNEPNDFRAVGPSEPCRLPRPNVIVVVLDDARADGLDAMPVLQAELADRGAVFENAFVPDSVCCPSRASILTGIYALRHGTRQIGGPIGGADVFRESGADQQTLAVWLQEAGYATGLFGKYLNAYSQTEQDEGPNGGFYVPPGWDRWWAFVSPEQYGGVLGGDYRVVDEHGVVTSYTDHSSDAQYSTDLSAAVLRSFVAEAVGNERPFFAYWAPYAPHGANAAVLPAPAVRHDGLFASLPLWRPPSWDESDVSDKPRWMQELQASRAGDLGLIIAGLTDFIRQKQYESLLAVDEQLGQIFALLEDLEVDQDTLVILVSDNGLGWGEHQSWGSKETPYEESIRVPLMVRYPRRFAPRAEPVATAALNLDVATTVADLAGLEIPYEPDGRSLAGWLAGETPSEWREDFLLEYWRTLRGSRLNYSGQPVDGDQVRLFVGDPRAEPRHSLVFEFDLAGGVAAGSLAVPIGANEDDTFTNLTNVAAAALPGIAVFINRGGNTLYLEPADPLTETLHFREVRDLLARFAALEPIPDYFGVRDVANGFTWVEYETGERELYDLNADPDQLQNRAGDAGYAGVRAAFETRLSELLAEIESR